MSMTSENLLYTIKLAEQAGRYEEMVEPMKKIAMTKLVLNTEERNLFSVAYKNAVGTKRTAWRTLASIEQREETKPNNNHLPLLRQFKSKVEDELNSICTDVITLLDNVLLVNDTANNESQVFLLKMKGDYYRYMSEYSTGDILKKVSEKARESYERALEIASKDLSATNPLRLGLALNFSVFYYEIIDEKEKACVLAKKAFDAAIEKIEELPEEQYRDSTTIMQLIRDNLALWTSDLNEEVEAN